MSNITLARGTTNNVGHLVNQFFKSLGYDSPVHPDHHNGNISAVLDDGVLCGAAYASTAGTVADTLFLNGYGAQGLSLGTQIQSLDAVAVRPTHRGRGYGRLLLESIAAHAKVDYGARYLVTRVDEDSAGLTDWFAASGFYVAASGQSLSVAGVPMRPEPGYRDAWLRLGDVSLPVT